MDLLFESEVLLQAQSMDRERDVHQHIGDFTLFMAGLFPEYLRRLKTSRVDLPQGFPRGLYEDGKALLRDCRANGRQSIRGRASSVPETLRQLRTLCHRPGVRAVRSGSHERSGLPAGSESSPQLTSRRPLILAHGGAGSRRVTPAQAACLADALAAGYGILAQGGSALAAVDSTIGLLEQSGLFNAGRGANRQLDGAQRMDAAIMEGAHLKAGAIASVEGIVHPISAARLVMEETNHVLLVGPFAGRFARHFKLKRHRSTGPSRRFSLRPDALETYTFKRERHGTVGAVALDRSGTVAAGASTGGIESMLPGRVGDSPLIGCGVYADNQSGAVSMTGIGEGIIRLVIAKSICDRLAMGKSPAVAARQVLRMLVSRIHGSAGALVLSPDGRFAIRHVTPHMAAGWWNGTGQPTVRGQFP